MVNPQDFINMMHEGFGMSGNSFTHNPQEFQTKLTMFIEKFEQALIDKGEDCDVDLAQPQIRQMQNLTMRPIVDVIIFNKKTQVETCYCIGYDNEGYTWQTVFGG